MSVPEGYTLLKEGQATILQHGNDVFYNPAQVSALRPVRLLISHSISINAGMRMHFFA